MRVLGVVIVGVSILFVSGCKSQNEQLTLQTENRFYDADVEAEPFTTYIDSDDDGLCDSSERIAGTSAEDPDSDGDSYPDVVEVSYGFDPRDPNVPRDEQIVNLLESSGASESLIVRVQVDGNGEQYTGLFESFDPFDSQSTTAADLLVGVRALGADPPDNVHGIEENAARFASVQGPTELTFSIRFEFKEQLASECKRGYPFRFSAKRPDKSRVGVERYLVVSIPAESDLAALSWCIPEPCL